MSVKSTWWSVTAFGDEIKLCQGQLPEFVRSIMGGLEKCPETGTEHFQGAIQCYEQIRMPKLKTWLKKAHLEPARQVEALKKYAMKAETAIGEKTDRNNPIRHLLAQDICLLLARQTDRQADYWSRVRMILAETPELAGQLMNPSLRNFYEKTEQVWLSKIAIVLQQSCSCDKDECEECALAEQAYIKHGMLAHAAADRNKMYSSSINASQDSEDTSQDNEGEEGE